MALMLSLTEAIATGRIGGLSPGSSIIEVGVALGPPLSYTTDTMTGAWEWQYEWLAFVFDAEPPYPLRSFRIDGIRYLTEPLAVLGNPASTDQCIALNLDGLTSDISPSTVLVRLIAVGAAPCLLFWSDSVEPCDFKLIIKVGPVQLHFEGEVESADAFDTLARKTDARTLARHVDGCCRLVDIVWSASTGEAIDTGAKLLMVVVADYLLGAAMITPKPASASPAAGIEEISLTDFLVTGHLGPIMFPMTAGQVGALIGPPRTGRINEHTTYWGFGHLELLLEQAAPHRMPWFQIEYAKTLSGDCLILPCRATLPNGTGGPLVISLEGLSGASSPSVFVQRLLSRGVQPVVTVEVGKDRDSFTATVAVGSVTIIFADRERYGSPLPGIDGELARAVEARGELDSIYSYDPELEANHSGKAGIGISISGERFLSLLRASIESAG